MEEFTRQDREYVYIENSRFIYATNFAGDPTKDKFKSTTRRGNLIIPNEEQAQEMMDAGYNVKFTSPKAGEEEGFVPTYYIPVIIGYNHPKRKPKVYLVTNNKPTELDEDSVHMLDNVYVLNVNATLYPRKNEDKGTYTMYVVNMYVEQDVDDDPWASRYQWSGEEVNE